MNRWHDINPSNLTSIFTVIFTVQIKSEAISATAANKTSKGLLAVGNITRQFAL
jgi:hypothetical protein